MFKKTKINFKKLLPVLSVATLLSSFSCVASAAETGTANTFTGVLGEATTVFAWFLKEMANLVSFILDNPLVMAMFMILLCGSVVGMFFRIWHNA